MIELADKWTRQPPRALGINRESPLTAGLTRLTMPGIDFGRTRSGLYIPASLGAIPTAVGVAGNFNGSASLDVGPMDSSALTVMVGAIADSGSLKYLFGLEYNGAAEPLTLRINSGSLEFSVYEGGVVNDFVSVSAPSADTYNTFYGIAPPDGTTGTHEVGFFSQQGAKTSATKSIQVSARNGVEAFVGAGKGLGSPWRQYAKPILWAATWKRQLTSSELAEVARNPWQLYAKRPKRVFVTAGGGGGDVTVALSGQAATASAGTLVPSSSKALSGQAATISAGTLTPSISKALSGTAVTVSAGTLTPSRTVPLSGQAVTVSAGTITYNAGSDITLALSGAEVTASAGTLVPSSSVSLAGSAVTASAGTVVPTFPRTLSGSAVTVSAGTVTPSMSVPLVGQAVTVSAGTLTYAPEGDVTVALTGEAVTVSAGTLTASGGDSNQASGGFAGGWHAIVKGKRVFGSRDQLIRLMQAEAEEDAKEAAEEKPRAKAKPKPKKVIEEVTEVIEENTVGFIPAPPEVVRRDETAIRNMLSRIYADAYRAEFERQAAIKRRMEDDEDDEAILLFL